MGYWSVVANRLYYACFYAVSALLIQNNLYAKSHSGTISLFGLHIVMKNLISKDFAKLYSKLFEMRQTGDYDDIYLLSENDVSPLIQPTKDFVATICKLLEN